VFVHFFFLGCMTCCCVWNQILRWNWSRVVVALSFARSTASMAFALRFSVLPLVESIMHLAFENGVEQEDSLYSNDASHEHDIRLSTIDLQHFTRTKYFETEHHKRSKPRARKVPDS
jgi:hypothetical protein